MTRIQLLRILPLAAALLAAPAMVRADGAVTVVMASSIRRARTQFPYGREVGFAPACDGLADFAHASRGNYSRLCGVVTRV